MANYITNNVLVTGDQDEIDRLIRHVASLQSSFDFNQVIPAPDGLWMHSLGSHHEAAMAHIANCGPRSVQAHNYILGWVASMSNTFGEDKSTFVEDAKAGAECLIETGHASWYTWNVAHWGTKSASTRCSDWANNRISFQTAWEHPYPVFTELSTQFPSLTITVEYASEDTGFECGTVVYSDGDHEFFEPEDPFIFAIRVLGPEEDEL